MSTTIELIPTNPDPPLVKIALAPSTVVEGPDGWTAAGYIMAIDQDLEVVRRTYDHAVAAWAHEARALIGARRSYAAIVDRPVVSPPPGADTPVRLLAEVDIAIPGRREVRTAGPGEVVKLAVWQADALIRDALAERVTRGVAHG